MVNKKLLIQNLENIFAMLVFSKSKAKSYFIFTFIFVFVDIFQIFRVLLTIDFVFTFYLGYQPQLISFRDCYFYIDVIILYCYIISNIK